MAVERIEYFATRPRAEVRKLSRRIGFAFLTVALLACLVACVLLVRNADIDRRVTRERALRAAVALSFRFDQEVASVNYLLKGLATSPALAAGDIRAFHQQMKATQVPKGSWLLLQDLNGQVANTLRPFGDPLPSRTQMPNFNALVARLRERPWTVSGRIASSITGGYIVGLSLRLDNPEGELRTWLTTILAEPRLAEILDAEPVLSGWRKVLFDRDLAPIVSSDKHIGALSLPAPEALKLALAAAEPNSVCEGLVEGVDEQGVPILVAYRRSAATNWTEMVSLPLSEVNAPLNDIAERMLVPGSILLVTAIFGALITMRQVETPFKYLHGMVARAQDEVAELSHQLLSLQEEERRRIARELHDSTVQRLVATTLGLARLDSEMRRDPERARATRSEIAHEVELALNELRVFAYLLHPPDLVNDGLAATLRDFVVGFCKRTNLRLSLSICDSVDQASLPVQLALLRVVQEALSNVHRHARASQVHVGVRVWRERIFLRIHDNGAGLPSAGLNERGLLGVGIPGMRGRLRQFGGDLKIAAGSSGIAVIAWVPCRPNG